MFYYCSERALLGLESILKPEESENQVSLDCRVVLSSWECNFLNFVSLIVETVVLVEVTLESLSKH